MRVGQPGADLGAGDAEVGHRDPPVPAEHQVRRLDVAVHDPEQMHGVQRVEHLGDEVEDLGSRKEPAPLGGMGVITADARDTWADTTPAGLDIEPEELVTWGAASSADLFCWLARGKPAEWPVMVFSHGDDVWTRHDFGVAEFLCRVLQARPGVEVMADSPLWGQRHPSYVSSAERRRAREAGSSGE